MLSHKKKNIYRNQIAKTKIILDDDDEIYNDDIPNNDIDSDLESEKEIENNEEDETNIKNIIHEKFRGYTSDVMEKYIVRDKIIEFGSNGIFCNYLWSGVSELDKWELNRKIDVELVKKLVGEMEKDYKVCGKFKFYEPVHLGLKKNNIFYVIDGQHRLLAYQKLFKKNKYPIQQIPCVVWFPENDDEFIEIFDKINLRTPLDKTKLFNYKINDIIKWMNVRYDNSHGIWGYNRPKINKELFVEKMRETEQIHKLDTSEIIKKIESFNDELTKLGRNERCKKSYNAQITNSVHNSMETINFYLGCDKELRWITDEFNEKFNDESKIYSNAKMNVDTNTKINKNKTKEIVINKNKIKHA